MGLMDIRRRILADAPQLATATGAVASFSTDMAVPLKKCEFAIEPWQEGTGDPSPTNVRAIHGWTGVNGRHTGNVIIPTANAQTASARATAEYRGNNIRITNTATGQYNSVTWTYLCSQYAGQNVTLNVNAQSTGGGSARVYVYSKDINGTSLGTLIQRAGAQTITEAFTVPENAYQLIISLFGSDNVSRDAGAYSDYTNFYICPTNEVSAITSIPVEFPAVGKNLLPSFVESTTKDGVTFTVAADGSVTVNGTATATTSYKSPSSTWKWDGTENCWLSGCPQGGSYSGGYSLRVDAFNGGGYSDPDVGSGCLLSAALGNIANTSLCYCIVVRSGTVCNNIVFKPQLQTGSTATSYEPYTNTVYGGSINLTTGVLTVTWAAADMGDLSWTGVSDYFRASALPAKAIGVTNIICTCYPTSNSVSATQMANKSIKGYDANNYIYAKDTDYETGTAFGTAVTGQKIVYELATPITYQLTPQQITALKGQNNVWCDTGNTTVQYWKH